jgi:AraC family transcriptional regulator
MSVTPNILATARVPFGVAQIVEWRWPSPMDVTACDSAHMIEMPLPPLAADGTASFPDISPQRFSVMGSLFLRPAGVMIRARSPGGHIRVVRLAAEPARFAEIAGGEIRRDEAVLRTALDLRADRPRLLLHRIRDELTSPGFGSDALIEAYGAALMIETVRALLSQAERKGGQGRLAGWQYRRVCDRIESEEAPPTVSELARLCGLSVRHFVRLYRMLAGESVTARIARTQLTRASALLHEDALPLKEIAARLGFTHASSFSTAFRRATGLSPSRYRQQSGRR